MTGFRFPCCLINCFTKVYTGGIKDTKDDGKNNQGKVAFDGRNITKEITGKGEDIYPENITNNTEHKEPAIFHGTHTGNKGSKGADNGHKTCNNQGFTSMLLIKGMCIIQVFSFDQAVILFINLGSQEPANEIICIVT